MACVSAPAAVRRRRRALGCIVGVPLLLHSLSAPLGAQIKSLPVYPEVAPGPGWALAFDYGSGLNAASGRARHIGGRAARAVGRLQLTMSGGVWDPGVSTSVQLGGTAAVRVIGGKSLGPAVSGIVGVGRVASAAGGSTSTYWTFPLGVAVTGPSISTPRGVLVPWLVPRAEVDRAAFGPVLGDQLGAGFSAGITADVAGGLGVHGAFDWLRLFRRTGQGVTLAEGTRTTIGLGVHLRLSRGR